MAHDLLRELSNQKSFWVKQSRPKCLELLGCWEYKNKYSIQDETGHMFYEALEESDCLMRACCGNSRGFRMMINDNQGGTVIELDRPYKICWGFCCMACYPTCTQALYVRLGGGELLGTVEEHPSWGKERVTVKNAGGELLYNLVGTCCMFSCGGDIKVDIFNVGGVSVGTITKVWRGWGAEAFTDSDNFRLDLDQAVSNEDKALLLGATFLIDFMYFEEGGGGGV